ncbi:RNA polymerase II subunit A C-terminal domain phosphatase [Parastagonospora nodorum]|nr:RNA polymerase II subunit A C-terminal domain phosphatase [Parastagonospora nodorum]KAH4011583.1 RNA polymerase II subunit A C-terminal domain phosphatase [Parastagonospora nodorum]KAH4034497.1 RNA polymerase II subunit A C-terminal domain phosphatase [Parastagonospora nodorum]KAH4074423.1 RNA polymerase II subunit A C-terminal domain phosphatase [Parastagonospora nodorum]KAH4096482.1 RNA polymerase II subunit A C-terminal domain phosphatase [Parastagonospora nodorum]
MKISSPPGLRYPYTIQALHKRKDEDVKRSDKLFTCWYEETVTEEDRWGVEEQVKKKWQQHFDATTGGKIARWFVKPGTVVVRPGVELVEIEEPCTHETQFGGLCVDCGEDMTKVDYLTKERDVNRATVNLTHDNTALLVSHNEAVRAEEDTKKRLLNSKKLTLIVDLDQTVIHTTCERTVAEWQADPENPNYEAVKDVKGFQLADDNLSNVAANWYYVKMRPGLKEFFDKMSKLYEMHVYTMATRAYAQAIMKIIDPDRKYFGDRILSRDENYTDKLKNLTRLFYQNTAMVVIIDDRADVWQYSPHLVRVPVFNFFLGAGDINAAFLPKQQELVTQAKDKPPTPPNKVAQTETGLPAPVSVAGEGGEVLEQQAKEQEKVIIAQQTERPLLQQQLMLDKEDAQAEDAEVFPEAPNGEMEHVEHPKARHSVLNDDDRGLEIIEKHLVQVHRTFYDEYVKAKAIPAGGRIAELKGEKSPKKRALSDIIPDVAEIMPRIKEEVLDGVVVVFSGIIPLGVDVQTSDYALWIRSFGAEVTTSVNRRTTHVIANPDRKTTKVKQAARYQHIKIVNPEWMFQCCTRWEHVDETPYSIEIDPAERGGSPFGELEDESINATGDEEPEEPAESPVELELTADNWASVDDELADFLNETDTDDDHESDSDSVRSDNSTASDAKQNKKKRKRAANSADVSEAEESDSSVASASKLQRRKKRSMERVTSLTNVLSADKSSGLPSPETTGPEEGQGDDEEKAPATNGVTPDLQEDYDDGLEAELLAGFGDSDDEHA